jgi:dolichyl-phosphate beta-glucosyltransferase
MGKMFNRIIWLLGVRGVSDTQCGFKLLAGDAARELGSRLTLDGFAYDVELVWLARRLGYPVEEVGVIWINSPDSRVDPIRSSVSMFRDVIRMRFRHSGRLSSHSGGR